jgi:hypothetical protein
MAITFELNSEILAPVIQRSTGDRSAQVKDFSITTLKPGVGNPTSLGVYRVTSTFISNSIEKRVSLVVKHLADGRPEMDTTDISSWNHWRREIEFFESPLVKLIPASIHFPAYFGHTALDNGTQLFWNEDLGDLEKIQWSWSDCLRAAELVADLNSIDVPSKSDYPWLNTSQLEGWKTFRPTHLEPLFPKVTEIAASNPAINAAFENYNKYLHHSELIISTLHSARQCFVHGDFNLNNLVIASDANGQFTALDWQLCGIASVGSEVAAIFNTARELGVIRPSIELFDEICSVYAERFNSHHKDNPVALNEVRLTAAAMGYYILEGVGFYFHQPDPAKSDQENDSFLAEMLLDFAEGPLNMYASVLNELLGEK